MTSTDVDISEGLVTGQRGPQARPVPPEEDAGRAGFPDRRAADAPASRLGRRLTVSRLALLIVVLLSSGLVALHIHDYRQLSVYDEPHHVDYVYRVLEGNIPRSGDVWLPPTIAAVACRSIDYPLTAYPPCGGPATRDVLPNTGLMTAFIHTPVYYVIPAGAVWFSAHALPFHIDEISVMRSTGILWLAAALVLMWLIWRELGVPWPARAGVALLVVASPVVLLAHSTVSNDATGLAAGAAVTLVALRWDTRRTSTWLAVAVAVGALLLKATALLVLIMASVFVLVRCLQRTDLTRQRWWKAFDRRVLTLVGLFAAACVVVGVGWSAFESTRATLDPRLIPQTIVQSQHHFDPSWLPASLLTVIQPLDPQFLQSVLHGPIGASVGALVNVAVMGLALVGVVRSAPGSTVRALAIATAVAALAFPPLLTLMNYQSLGIQFSIPARYGLTLVPALAGVGATALKSRGAQLTVVAAALLMYAAVAFHLIAR